MAEVLYRKYRSRTFAEVQGQESVINVILSSLQSGRNSHAYLLAGPRGTGKTTIARLIAKAVNCDNFTTRGDVCNECASCLAVEAGNHLDVVEIDAASNRGIDEIREIRDTIHFLPNSGKFKVFIIDEAHMLTREAFNALLKTLEEPPAHVLFLLATTEPHKVPVTILSRLQRFDLKLATPEQLFAKLAIILKAEGYTAEPEMMDLLYRYSDGSYRDAESMLGKIISSSKADEPITITRVSQLLGMPSAALVQSFLGYLVSGEAQPALELVAEAAVGGSDFAHLIKSMTTTLRDDIVTVVKQGGRYERELLVLHTLMSLQAEVKQTDDMRLLLEIAILKLASKPQTQVSHPATPQAQSPASAPVAPKPSQPRSQPAQRATIKSDAPSSPAGQWERLLGEVQKLDFKLWTILKTCTGVYADGTLSLSSGYRSNIAVLEDESAVARIRPVIDMVYSAGTLLHIASNSRGPDFESSRSEYVPDSNAGLVEEIF